MTRLALVVLLALPGLAAAQRRPAAPTFTFEGAFAYLGTLCDCDERDFVFQTLGPVAGHAQPDRSSPVVRTVAAGRRIEGNDWNAVVTVVTRPARGVLRTPVRLPRATRMPDPRRGVWDDRPTVDVTVPAGARVEVFSNYGGDGFVGYDGVTYSGSVAMGEEVMWDAAGENAIEDETWYRLVPRRGAPAAWVALRWGAPDATVRVLCETHGGCVPGVTPTYRPRRR